MEQESPTDHVLLTLSLDYFRLRTQVFYCQRPTTLACKSDILHCPVIRGPIPGSQGDTLPNKVKALPPIVSMSYFSVTCFKSIEAET